MKKKATAMLLAMGLSLTAVLVSACGGSSSGSAPASEPAAEEAAEEEPAAEEPSEETAQEAPAAEAPAEGTTAEESSKAAEAQDQVQAKTVTPEPASGKFHIELTEAGGFEDDGSYYVTYDSVLRGEGEEYQFCFFDGSAVDSRSIVNMDYLGWGLYSVAVQGDDINSTGLVTADGDVIIPFDAAIIEWPYEHPVDRKPRYVLVLTGTETTTNESEALFFVTDRMYAFMADEGDTLYKGTIRVFDLETRQYVPGLEFARGSDTDFSQVGENILTDLSGKDTVYSPSGQAVYTAKSYMYCSKDYLTDSDSGTYMILDANGKELYRADKPVHVIEYNSPYFQKMEDKGYTVIDSHGNTVLGTPWYTIYGESCGRFRVKGENDSDYSLVAADNSVIVKSDSLYAPDDRGFFTFGESDNYTLITPDNRIYEKLSGNTGTLLFTNDDNQFLVLNTGEYAALPGSYELNIVKGVFSVEDDNGKYAAYDTFTGNELLGFEFDKIRRLNDDYLYAVKGNTVTIYKVEVVAD